VSTWARGEKHSPGLRIGLRRSLGGSSGTPPSTSACAWQRPPAAQFTSRTCRLGARLRPCAAPRRLAWIVTCEVNHWAPFLSTWDDVERLGPYALSYWVPDEGREAVLGRHGRRHHRHLLVRSRAPYARRKKEIGWKEMWSCHTGTPGIQYYYPLLLDAVNQGKLTLERGGVTGRDEAG